MHFSTIATFAIGAASVSAHGTITLIHGANGVNMPGLTVLEGTPRNCDTLICGAHGDTALIREWEMNLNIAGPLGRTLKGGRVDPVVGVANFMGTAIAPAKDVPTKQGRPRRSGPGKRSLVEERTLALFKTTPGANTNTQSDFTDHRPAQLMPGQGKRRGLPTCDDNGRIHMTYHQVNQDGAGPLNAMIDPVSGGRNQHAFVQASMIDDVPGVLGFSLTTVQAFDITVQLPEGMVCQGQIAGQTNVCVVRVNNVSLAGPFGGSAVFVQSRKCREKAIQYNKMKKRHFARGVVESDAAPAEDIVEEMVEDLEIEN